MMIFTLGTTGTITVTAHKNLVTLGVTPGGMHINSWANCTPTPQPLPQPSWLPGELKKTSHLGARPSIVAPPSASEREGSLKPRPTRRPFFIFLLFVTKRDQTPDNRCTGKTRTQTGCTDENREKRDQQGETTNLERGHKGNNTKACIRITDHQPQRNRRK